MTTILSDVVNWSRNNLMNIDINVVLLVYQLATFNVCSPFLTQPAHRDVITWPLCCEIASGFLLSSASSTSCVRLFIVVCTATHHPTYSRPHHAVCCCKCQIWSEISRVVDRRSALSSFGDRSFATVGPRAWNKLPSHLRLMQSADTFRRHFKTFLFHQAFLSWHC